MSFGLTHSGAIARGLGYAPTPRPRAPESVPPADERAGAAEPANVSAAKPVQPNENPAQVRERLREQVMAERGVDLFDLYRMGSQERIRTETFIMVETALRTRQASARTCGGVLDLRV